jgi:DNA-binding NarL/FixJ family response regulator
MTSIVLADDHELIRESVASLLREVPNFHIVSQCINGRQLIKSVDRFHPNVVITDISMPELNGVEAVKQIRKISPATRIIALSIYIDEVYIKNMIDAGVSGYVVKSGAARDLIEAIRNGSRGKLFFSSTIEDVAAKIQNSKNNNKEVSLVTKHMLTTREREVLQLIGEGFSSTEIGLKLNISVTTVKTHRNNLMDKLYVRDIAGLTRHSIRLKLVNVE